MCGLDTYEIPHKYILKDAIFIQCWKFKGFQILLLDLRAHMDSEKPDTRLLSYYDEQEGEVLLLPKVIYFVGQVCIFVHFLKVDV